jgi:hypothetical protein
MNSDVSAASREEITALDEALKVQHKLQMGEALLDKMKAAIETSRWRLSESMVTLYKRLRDQRWSSRVVSNRVPTFPSRIFSLTLTTVSPHLYSPLFSVPSQYDTDLEVRDPGVLPETLAVEIVAVSSIKQAARAKPIVISGIRREDAASN